MGVLRKLPDDSAFLPTLNLFTANFNAPTVGFYDWATAANTKQTVLGISPGFLYNISIMNFGASIDEGTFLQNVSVTPKVQFLTSLTGRGLFGGGYPIANYLKNNEVSAYFWTTLKGDSLVATFTGLLGQNALLAGIPSVTGQVALNIFQISDKDYIDKFFGLTGADKSKPGIIGVPPELEERI